MNFGKKNGVHPCIYKMCKDTTSSRKMNGEPIGQWEGNALRFAWSYTRRPKFGQKELHGFVASEMRLICIL